MVSKEVLDRVAKLEKLNSNRKERIDGFKLLSKLSKDAGKIIISEYDLVIKRCDETYQAIMEGKELMRSSDEQVRTHVAYGIKQTTQGFKDFLTNPEKMIVALNDAIELDNIRIKELLQTKKNGGNIC